MKEFNLEKFRKCQKMTQKQIAAIVGCGQSFISAIENGQDKMPVTWITLLEEKLDISDIGDYMTDVIAENDNVVSENNIGTAITGKDINVNPCISEITRMMETRDSLVRDIMKSRDESMTSKDKQIEKLFEQNDRLLTSLERVIDQMDRRLSMMEDTHRSR